MNIEGLENNIGYTFSNKELLKTFKFNINLIKTFYHYLALML